MKGFFFSTDTQKDRRFDIIHFLLICADIKYWNSLSCHRATKADEEHQCDGVSQDNQDRPSGVMVRRAGCYTKVPGFEPRVRQEC